MIPVRDNLGRRGWTPVTWILAGIWIAAWIGCARLDHEALAAVHEALALDGEEWRRAVGVLLRPGAGGDYGDALFDALVPLVGYKLVHGGAVQVLSNALFFVLFAGRLEARAGSLRFLMFHELAGALAALTQLLWWGDQRTSSVGASASVAAAIAAYVLLHRRSRVLLLIPVVVVPVFVEVPALLVVTAWAVLQIRPISRLLEIGPAVPLAWQAYLGGIAAGALLTPWLLRVRKKRRGGRR